MMANNKNAELVCNTAIVINAMLMGIQWWVAPVWEEVVLSEGVQACRSSGGCLALAKVWHMA